jgi:cell division protein ZipA
MDAATLRLILIVVGTVLVLALYLWERSRCEDDDDDVPLSAGDKREPSVWPFGYFGEEDDDLTEAVPETEGQREATAVARLHAASQRAAAVPEAAVHLVANASPDVDPNSRGASDPMILQLGVRAREAEMTGPDILDAAARCGLRPGESGAFHRRVLVGDARDLGAGRDAEPGDDQGDDDLDEMRTLFSMVSMVRPGEFPFDAMEDFRTRGLLLYAVLRRGQGNLVVLDEMIAVARRLADEFDAELLDERRKPLTTFMVDVLRNRVRELDSAPSAVGS